MNNTQEEITNDMCKTHTGKIERDFYRICPSKLSKRELEDMYFALVENNIELKKTVNGQREQIKLLNTKVQRMMAQRPINTRDLKECCINNKAIINEQREVIADLKKSNDRLTERIRLLNMRLCSAKQFLKKGQLPSSARCPKCCNGVPASVKNSSTTGINVEPIVRSANASCQYLASETAPVISVDTTREQEVASRSPDGLCDQNKCHTVMEELKQSTIALQQELSQTHEDYASRIKRLEEEMAQLTHENMRVRSESTSSEHHLEQQRGEISDLLQRLRKCEAQCEHLSVQLKIEKSRSAELEMRAKAADMSSAIATAVEQHLANLNLQKMEQEKRIEPVPSAHSITDADNSSMYHCQFQLVVPNNSISSQTDKGSQSSSEKIINRTSDDSGYTDTNRSNCSSEVSPTKNVKVMAKIAELHEQLKLLKQSLAENCEKGNDFNESPIQRRKSCFERPSCSTNNENFNNPPLPGDSDYLIRTNRLNSYKNINEWRKDFDKSDADSSICENRPSILSTTKDIRRRRRPSSVNEKDPKNEQKYEEGTFLHKKCVDDNADEASCINIPKLDLTNINEPTEGNKTHRKEETDSNEVNKNEIVESKYDSFNFTKETIPKIDGKLVSEAFREMDRKSTDQHGNESNTNLTEILSNIINKNVASTSKNIVDSKEIINRKFVSTGVDPIDFSTKKKFEEACALADPLPLLEKNRLDICEQSVRVCACPETSRRAMSTFRSCSGALRLTATPSNSQFRKCGCADNRLHTASAFKGREDFNYVRKTSTPTPGTYVLHGEAVVETSPDTTRCEISSLTDLPSDKEVLSTQTSPGQDKSTCTLSDETPHTTTDYGSLSEGELPLSGRKRQSIDEAPTLDDKILRRRETSTSEKMEETLRAISEELSRCKHLLQIHSSHESTKSTSQDACTVTQTKPPISKLNTEIEQTDRENPCLAYRNNRLSCPNDGPDCRNNVPDDRTNILDNWNNRPVKPNNSQNNQNIGIDNQKNGLANQNIGLDDRNNDLVNGKKEPANLNSGFDDRSLVSDKLSFGMNNSNPGFDIRHSELNIRKSGLTLRKCDANERLGGVSAKCIFTLHVGTVILSDQAVITSRGKSLALTWRFYDQPPSMTHQLAGRVMQFDFSLEYDVRLSQNLLDYLKHEEMPMIVCEIDKQEKPFAICLLPLRDALLHTNKRVDMSLALIADTGIKRKDASVNSFTINEELGVLDVWCMLRVPPSMMSVINDVISQTIASFHRHPSSMERIVDEDHNDFHRDSKYLYDSENEWRGSSAKQTDGPKRKSVSIIQKVPGSAAVLPLPAVTGKLSDDNNSLGITILWLALNEECRAMNDARVKRLYVAFAFLGKAGADMETPSSLPKPRNFMDKCHFNFRKSFALNEGDMAVVGQMAQRRQDNTTSLDPKDCIIFSIISEPPEDPLGLESCEDIGYAYLFLGDALSSNGNSYTEVLPIRIPGDALVCGRLGIRVDGLSVLRACIQRTRSSSK